MNQQIYLSDVQTGERYGVARGSVWRWTKKNPSFPKPYRISKGCVRWSLEELERFENQVKDR